ncbi:Scd6-like Sm domain-containing protein [Xylariaceae sp. FL0594]|nr:Scd6-like Sm domain-containing protein [Xylariaceae sp. FL0594]
MSEFLGARISLISKSDIRYSGILHEINSEDSTVSLQNVRSYGTEGRRGNPSEEVAASDQMYEYIVFRGSDVKDLRIEQTPTAPKENQPPPVPNDPAIVGARTRPAGPGRPGPPNQGPGPAGFGQSPYPPNFYPPPPGQWGRGGPMPGPGQGFNGMPYPPPPGWFPPGQGFPPGGPGPWNHYGGFPPGPQGPPGTPGQGMRPTPQQDSKPTPIGAGVDKQRPVGVPAVELPTESKTSGQPASQPAPVPKETAPTPPVESKPTVAEVKATADSLASKQATVSKDNEPKSVPTLPKSNRITPAVPIPGMVPPKTGTQTIAATAAVKSVGDQANGPPSAAAIRDATQAAKAAVAMAMAQLDKSTSAAAPAVPVATNNTAMDNLTKKVNEMRVNATRGVSGRGRGRGGRGNSHTKVEVPDADFDFETANAKFNKQEIVKEAAVGSPVVEAANGTSSEATEVEDGAYNKTKSFFDNISSEAKDRAENSGHKPGGREWRGEEQRKNMETFGQGSVDGGYRGGYRGRRGRGRGGMRGRGGPRPRGGFSQPPLPPT